jgi:general secretion pathway protein G
MTRSGFSLIELLIVVAIISALTGVTMLRTDVIASDARTATLRHNLKTLRQALHDHYTDRRQYPARLAELVERRYLRGLPVDPTTGSNETWIAIPSRADARDVADVKSPADGAL